MTRPQPLNVYRCDVRAALDNLIAERTLRSIATAPLLDHVDDCRR
ncbi:hypothetical protein [Burkholderia cenocepacia]|nr:hypothetical protein [Burkholderia cenocepacia]